MSISFIKANKENIKGLSILLNQTYKGSNKNIFEKYFIWVLQNERSVIIAARTLENQLVCSRPGIGWTLSLNNEKIDAYQFGGTAVHPDYRRMGLFSNSNKFFLEKLHHIPLVIFNVSVDAARKGYEKLGWEYLPGFQRLTKFSKLKVLTRNKGNFNIHVDAFDNNINEIKIASITEFLNERKKQFENLIHTQYDKKFLLWRISKKGENYLYIILKDVGFIIYKLQEYKGYKEVVIGEIFLKNKKYTHFSKIINTLKRKHTADLYTVYISKNHPLYTYYLRKFFLPNLRRLNLNFGVKLISPNTNKIYLNPNIWAISTLDLDTF